MPYLTETELNKAIEVLRRNGFSHAWYADEDPDPTEPVFLVLEEEWKPTETVRITRELMEVLPNKKVWLARSKLGAIMISLY
jgi:hypothetical protein